MWLQRFSDYLLQHRWQTVLLVFAVTFVPVIGIIGIIIAAFITLCEGAVEGAIVTIAASIPYLISFFVTGGNEQTLPLVVWAAVGIAVLSNILTWVFAVMLRKDTSWSFILQIAALLGVLVVSLVHLIYPDVVGWWGRELQAYYNQAQKVIADAGNAQAVVSSDAQSETIAATKQFATGMMVAAVLFNAILQLIVARWWQAILYMPGSLRKELHNIRLSQLAGVLFAVSVILSYLGNAVVLDIMPILYMLFAAAGLSLCHFLFGLRYSRIAWFWLTVFYVAVIISVPLSLVMLAFLALLDIWLDIRKRLKKVF